MAAVPVATFARQVPTVAGTTLAGVIPGVQTKKAQTS